MRDFRTNLVNMLHGVWFVLFGVWLIMHGETMQGVEFWQKLIVCIGAGILSFVPQFVWNWIQAVVFKQKHTALNDDLEVKRSWISGGVAAVAMLFIKVTDFTIWTALILLALALSLWGIPALYKKLTKK